MDAALLERAVEATERVVAGTSREDFGAPTPCTEWDVRDLLNHMIGGYEAVAVGAGDGATNTAAADFTATDHVEAWRGAAAKAVKALSAPDAMEKTFAMPWGETPGKILLNLMLADTVVHGCDLAKATRQDLPVEPDLAETVYETTTAMLEPKGTFPRGDHFGAPVEVPSDAPIESKMLAYLGRKP